MKTKLSTLFVVCTIIMPLFAQRDYDFKSGDLYYEIIGALCPLISCDKGSFSAHHTK